MVYFTVSGNSVHNGSYGIGTSTHRFVIVLPLSNICTFVVNFVKNLVPKRTSAMLKLDKYLMHWAMAMTTCLGKSVTAAMSLPIPPVRWRLRTDTRNEPEVKLSEAFEVEVFWV